MFLIARYLSRYEYRSSLKLEVQREVKILGRGGQIGRIMGMKHTIIVAMFNL